VSWGTDDNVHGESAGDTFGRSVNFVKASGSTALLGEGAVTASQLGLSGSLSSDGVTLSYQIVKTMTGVGGSWNGGYELIAYKAGGDYTDATDQVFRVTLDPTSTNGSYRFDLLGNLDHSASPANSENDLKLTFGFRATDADGDTASRATFSVTVDDDGPIVGVADSGIVDEDGGLAGGNPGPLFGGGDALLVPTNASGDLSILWGSDDGNRNVDGGFTGTQVAGDRSVVFGADVVAALEGQDLSSNGVELVYTVSGNGTVLTATAGASGPVVFTVSLSDQGTG
jgi:T1SS-143 domain-containing protein